MDISSPAVRAVACLVVSILHCFLNRYRDLIDLFKHAMGPMFYIGPTMGAKCSVWLTWDVFVHDLDCQLGTPSHWLPVDSCKEGQKGALAAVCTPTLKSASKKHQTLCTSVSEHRVWHSEGGKRETVSSVYFLPLAKIFPQSLVRNPKSRASN